MRDEEDILDGILDAGLGYPEPSQATPNHGHVFGIHLLDTQARARLLRFGCGFRHQFQG